MTASHIGRFSLIVLCFLSFSNSIARAGDYASREIIGFSSDGHYFAFEQFGVQAGSGFPYSEIFILDTARDQWVAGSPIRERIDDERAELADVREQARDGANELIERFGIGEPGDLLASNPRAELSADPYRVVVNEAHRFSPPKEELAIFTLTEKGVDPGECSQYTDEPIKGFTLEMRRSDDGPVTLHDDDSVPTTRGCTIGYAISDVLKHTSEAGETFAVLLHVTTVGFEGPNSRFLAVTRRMQ